MMKSDEGIFKMLSKSSIIRNQYENVRHIQHSIEFEKASFNSPFFYLYKKNNEHFDECWMNKMSKCYRRICVNNSLNLINHYSM